MALRVLVVDDASDVRVLVRLALRVRADIEVVGEAASGRTAAVLAAQLKPDAIVLDLHLPDIDGRETMAELQRASPESTIVVYSAWDSDREWYVSRGARYVRKDDGLDTLLAALS